MFDFSYFSHSDAINAKIESSEKLLDLDEELRENYSEIVTRFFLCFESVYKYAVDLNRYEKGKSFFLLLRIALHDLKPTNQSIVRSNRLVWFGPWSIERKMIDFPCPPILCQFETLFLFIALHFTFR
jgi:hypothetical protein